MDWTFYHFRVTDLRTNGTLDIDALTPHLISRYGFYQGGNYRTPPTKIIDFFHLKPSSP